MNRPDLLKAYSDSLLDSQRAFKADDFGRHMDTALRELAQFYPRRMLAELNAMPMQREYECPADLIEVLATHYGRAEKAQRQPWDAGYPTQRLPDVTVKYRADGSRYLQVFPAPSYQLLAQIGAVVGYEYSAAHVVTDTYSSLTPVLVQLTILRAQAEAMRELAMRNSSMPTQVKDSLTNTPANGTPSCLYQLLMDEFYGRVKRIC